MTKKIPLLITLALIFALLMCLSSCDMLGLGGKSGGEQPAPPPAPPAEPGENPGGANPGDDEPRVDLSGISLPSYSTVYNGKAHSLTIRGTLPAGVTVSYVGNGVVDAGTHSVSARFYYNGDYMKGMDITSTITIARARYDMYAVSFDGATVIAGGAPYELAVGGTLPAGVSVLRYEGNGKTEIGEHTVTAIFDYNEKNYEPIPNMTATLKVIDGPAELAGVCLPDLSAVYNGAVHTVSCAGAQGFSVTYTSASAKDAGEYAVSALISNGSKSVTLTSTLNIKPAKLLVSAEDVTVAYDGERHSIPLQWVGEQPLGVNVSVVGNDTAAIGTHTVRFRFSLSESVRGNYLYQPDITATLTIEPAVEATPDGLIFESTSDGYAVSGYTGSATSIVIPKEYTNSLGYKYDVVEVASGAFMNNTSLTYVYLPDTVKIIGNNAFRGCTNLKSVTLGSKVSAIGQLAFADTAISDVTLPDSLLAIGASAYRGAPVERIVLPFIGGSRVTSNSYIGYIFGATAYGGNAQYLPAELKTVILSDECTAVPAYSFYGASMIEEVVIGKGVTEIGISAFRGCVSLIGLYVPATVKDIPAAAHTDNSSFYECKDGFTLGTEVASKSNKPSGWGKYYDILNSTTRLSVEWGVSYQEYMDMILEATYFAKK